MFSISPLFSGSSGNATYIGSDRCSLLVDAGMTAKQMEGALKKIGKDPASLSAILITHEHTDHIKGVGVLSRRYHIPVYANAPTWEAMEEKLGGISEENIRVIDDEEFYISDICVQPIPIHHDAACPRGYALYCGNKKFSIVTDTGHTTKQITDQLAGSDFAILEANHDVEMLRMGRYPYYLKRRILSGTGHLSNDDAAKTAIELVKRGVRGILLGHLSKENNFPSLAEKTVKDALAAAGIEIGKDVALATANRSAPTGYYIYK